MIAVRVPGKLFVAGEYAVLEPGRSAVLVAVDRHLTVRLTARHDALMTVTSTVTGGRPVEVGTVGRASNRKRIVNRTPALGPVMAAIEICERLDRESAGTASGFDLVVESGLDAASGTKYGLGSSGAVVVGAVRTLCRHHRIALTDDELLRLCLVASISVDATGSGGDVAASLLGGWVHYTSPDRAVVEKRLADGEPIGSIIGTSWRHLRAERVPAPSTMGLLVGWTGSAVRTVDLVADYRLRIAGPRHLRFGYQSEACVTKLVAALHRGDDGAVAAAMSDAGALLDDLAVTTGISTRTRELDALRECATALGIASKSSGAGGGDCGIALTTHALAPALTAAWRDAGITPLELTVDDDGATDLTYITTDDWR